MSKLWRYPVIIALIVTLSACSRTSASAPVTGIAFVSERDGNQEIYVIQPDGSALERLTDNPAVDADPTFSPDGRQIAFRSRRDGTSDIFVMGADGSRPRNLIKDSADDNSYDETMPSWSADGQTLALITNRFYQQTKINAAISVAEMGRHQIALLPVSGGKDDITLLGAVAAEQRTVAWSPDGRYIAFSALAGFMLKNIDDNPQPVNLSMWDLREERIYPLTSRLQTDLHPAWSHDGRFLAFHSTEDDNLEIFVLELATKTVTNLTRHPAEDKQPTWSPDDTQIAFVSNRDGNQEIYIMNADGSDPRNVTQNPAADYWPNWSPVSLEGAP